MLLAILQIANAQTILQPGDVAIVQVNYTYNSFDFVCFVDIEAGTEIRFTDYAFSNTLNDFDQTTTSDGIYKFTAAQAITAGTVIQYCNPTNVNAQFTAIAGSSSLNLKSYKGAYLYGENLIAYQESNNVKTYLFAMGWMRKDNFSVNPNNNLAKVCDIPTGLSKSNYTVIQIDSVMKPGQNPQLARDFKYYKYDGFSNTAYMIRRWLSDVSSFSTISGALSNTAVDNFTVAAPDTSAPVLVSGYPTDNKINVSIYSGFRLTFNENVEVLKPISLKNTATQSTIIATTDEIAVSGAELSFAFDGKLDYATNYTIEIAPASIRDLNGNTWPAENTNIHFATSAKRSSMDFSFVGQKQHLKWKTQSTIPDFEGYHLFGYWSFDIDNIPMRWYINEHGESETSIPNYPSYNELVLAGMNNSRLVVDLSAINNTITNISGNVYENNCILTTTLYTNGNIVKTDTVTNSNKSLLKIDDQPYVKQYLTNEDAYKIDSIVYSSPEGAVYRIKIELIDLAAPTVELGNARVLCEGDSVQLDAGFTPGAVYEWNTGAKTQKIWAKTTDTYSVTVKNTLGQASDNVLVTVKPSIVLTQHPDTIFACVGETITLTPVQNSEFTYLWSPTGETTSTIQVTKSGNYKVLISNGSCLKVDSIVVKYSGASLRAFFNQGGMTGINDVQGELYKKENTGQLSVFRLYKSDNMPQFVQFDSLPVGEYLFKAHFVDWTFAGENPFMDTYHDGKTTWSSVTPFHLTCESDTMISFSLANKPEFEFNGTGVISGKIQIVTPPSNSPIFRMKSDVNVDCDTRIVLYNANGDIIATTCPDAQGNYSFTNLPAGNYSVGIERTGFEVQSLFTTTVTTGQTISNADFTVNEQEQSVVQGITTAVKNVTNTKLLKLSLVPNPAVGFTSLEFEMPNEGEATISISDLTGRMLQKENVLFQAGKNRIPVTVNQLSGIYFVKIATVAGSSTARLIVR